jgi:hypothetical protein
LRSARATSADTLNYFRSNTGAIVGAYLQPYSRDFHYLSPVFAGGIAGGVIFLISAALFAFFFLRRRAYTSVSKERPVNVLQDEEDSNGSQHDLPHYYTPDPYLVPDPTIEGSSDVASTHGRPHSAQSRPLSSQGRPLSVATTSADIRPQTPLSSTTTSRKTAAPPTLRPVNIIQHDDAGPSEPDTIELPPAYTNIRSPLANSVTAGEGDS